MKNVVLILAIIIVVMIAGTRMVSLTGADKDTDTAAIEHVLDTLHASAATADWDTYFPLFAEDSMFLGTDVSERWDKPTFMGYVDGRPEGWLYVKRERFIYFSPFGNTAWFDEILDSQNYGTSRGSGVLIRTKDGWKISQYNLTFPVPNDLAKKITQEIQAFEANN